MHLSRMLVWAAVLGAVLASPLALHAAEPYEIHVLASMTGGNALVGKQTADTLHIIEQHANQTGGINGRPVKFVIEDDETNPQVAVQLAHEIIAKNVPVILGPASVANCGAILPLIDQGPVLWCMSPGFHPPAGSYGFSSNVSTTSQIRDLVVYFHALGLTRLGLITSTDATGQDAERSIDEALTKPDVSGMKIVAREHFNATDVSVVAQMTRIKASGAQAMFAWTTGTPLATLLRAYKQVGLDIPAATPPSNSSATQLKQYAGFIPDNLIITVMFNQVSDPAQIAALRNGALKRQINFYYDAYRKTLGFAPDGNANIAWDSANIVLDALRKYGTNATARNIHDYIEGLHGWIGINGEYDFRDGSQRGLDDRNVVIVRWDPAREVFVAISRPGGMPLKKP